MGTVLKGDFKEEYDKNLEPKFTIGDWVILVSIISLIVVPFIL